MYVCVCVCVCVCVWQHLYSDWIRDLRMRGELWCASIRIPRKVWARINWSISTSRRAPSLALCRHGAGDRISRVSVALLQITDPSFTSQSAPFLPPSRHFPQRGSSDRAVLEGEQSDADPGDTAGGDVHHTQHCGQHRRLRG